MIKTPPTVRGIDRGYSVVPWLVFERLQIQAIDGHPSLDLLCPLLNRDLFDVCLPAKTKIPPLAEATQPLRMSSKCPSHGAKLVVTAGVVDDLLDLSAHGLP